MKSAVLKEKIVSWATNLDLHIKPGWLNYVLILGAVLIIIGIGQKILTKNKNQNN